MVRPPRSFTPSQGDSPGKRQAVAFGVHRHTRSRDNGHGGKKVFLINQGRRDRRNDTRATTPASTATTSMTAPTGGRPPSGSSVARSQPPQMSRSPVTAMYTVATIPATFIRDGA